MTTNPDGLDRHADGGSGSLGDESLIDRTPPMSSYPAFRGKQVVLSVVGALLAITMFVPWWDAEIPLDRVADTLNGWLLLATGLSIGSLGANTSYNWFGNALFGLVPVLPVLVLAVLCALRVSRVFVTPANTLFLFSLLSSAGALWLIFFGLLRVDAANGSYPVMLGPWVVLIVTLALGALCLAWWRTEQLHFPKRTWMGFGRAVAAEPEPDRVNAEGLFVGIEESVDDDQPVSFARGGVTSTDEIASLGDDAAQHEQREQHDRRDEPPSDAQRTT